jgi:hypothetical protein
MSAVQHSPSVATEFAERRLSTWKNTTFGDVGSVIGVTCTPDDNSHKPWINSWGPATMPHARGASAISPPTR